MSKHITLIFWKLITTPNSLNFVPLGKKGGGKKGDHTLGKKGGGILSFVNNYLFPKFIHAPNLSDYD
jgi:hypothetical protein